MKIGLLIPLLISLNSLVIGQDEPKDEHTFETKRGVSYIQRDESDLKADIYVPSGKGPYPAILMIHGGAWRTGQRSHMSTHSEAAAKRGYTAITISYRLAPKHKFPAQIEDCKAAVRWMRTNAKQYKIDSERVAAYGYSAGGHLACLLGTTDPEDGLEGTPKDATSTRVQAIVAGGAPCNFQWLPRQSDTLAYWLGGSRADKPDTYTKASPTAFVTRDDPPAFFFHGEKDRLVPSLSPRFMAETLKGAGVASEVLIIKGTGHIGAFMNKEGHRAALEFLDRVLKK